MTSGGVGSSSSKLLRLERAITTATLVDADGREALRVSRIEADRLSSGIDLSREPGVAVARTSRPISAKCASSLRPNRT